MTGCDPSSSSSSDTDTDTWTPQHSPRFAFCGWRGFQYPHAVCMVSLSILFVHTTYFGYLDSWRLVVLLVKRLHISARLCNSLCRFTRVSPHSRNENQGQKKIMCEIPTRSYSCLTERTLAPLVYGECTAFGALTNSIALCGGQGVVSFLQQACLVGLVQ